MENLLLSHGYRQFEISTGLRYLYHDANIMYQKRFKDEKGIRYFIEWYGYFPDRNHHLEQTWMAEIVTNEPLTHLQYHYIEPTRDGIKLFEDMAERYWTMFKFPYYEVY